MERRPINIIVMKNKGNSYKESVRRTKAWKDFRKEIIEERGSICESCGTKTKRISLHHADESLEHYADFTDKSKFFLVCSLCHKSIERLARIKPENWCKYNPLWVAFFSRFLIPPLSNYENRFNNK